jgi:hypothetical protein
MPDAIIDLRSVNWSQGMFLTPDHFLRQERYFDSALLWLLRFVVDSAGLIGGGPRIEPSERGAARFDPIVEVDDGGEALKIAVAQCRGLTLGGAIIDVDPSIGLAATFPTKALEGVTNIGIYVISRPHDKEADGGIEDPINPQIPGGRRARYEIAIDLRPDDAMWSLLLLRLRRSETGLRFERVPAFIPPCAWMGGHSELMQAFRQLNDRVSAIADHYSGLHRAIVDFVGLARSRAIGVEQDIETLEFVSRMLVGLEECAYSILDPVQSPRQFFSHTNRLIRNSALFLSLSPPAREYFRLLGEIGETEFVTMLQQEGEALEMGRRGPLHDDLGVEVQKVGRALERIDRLEQGLEGKYMDYRVSPSLESLNFFFDRTGEVVLYTTKAKPARPQAHGDQITFVFAPLHLETRWQYRIVLVGDQKARFAPGDRLAAELLINPGEGYRHEPLFPRAQCELANQRNFAVDFEAPKDVVAINDVRVTVRTAQPIRSAILYVRSRFLEGHPGGVLPEAAYLGRDARNPQDARDGGRIVRQSQPGSAEGDRGPTQPSRGPRGPRIVG